MSTSLHLDAKAVAAQLVPETIDRLQGEVSCLASAASAAALALDSGRASWKRQNRPLAPCITGLLNVADDALVRAWVVLERLIEVERQRDARADEQHPGATGPRGQGQPEGNAVADVCADGVDEEADVGVPVLGVDLVDVAVVDEPVHAGHGRSPSAGDAR